MTPLDRFIIVDWSAKGSPSPVKPSRDAIWVAEGITSNGRVTTRYFRTRQATITYLRKRLGSSVKKREKVLLGMDVIYAYPAGLAKGLRLKGKQEWKAIWALLHRMMEDDDRNRNNRFSVGAELNRRLRAPLGPFWGVPQGQSGIFLGAKKDFTYPVVGKKATLAEKRIVENRCPGMQPTWKLAYTGSVGSQGLTAIPYLYELRFLDPLLSPHSKVWPFETGFTADPLSGNEDFILHAEIWPSLVARPRIDKIPDREQVKYLAHWLIDAQENGTLSDFFVGPEDLTKSEMKRCLREEGWVLGVK